MTLVIRDASAADVPAILALFNSHVRDTTAIWRDREVDLADRMAWFEDRRRQGFPGLVAEEAGGWLGFASYGPFRTGSGYDGTVENSVYVAPEAQGRGVATQLMDALLAHARAGGRKVMVAGIGLPNDASVRLHRKAGFVEAGIL
ncbi:MAG: GNAT family N-acetyltransferase, partial [Beijerinckiaceae bacterium]